MKQTTQDSGANYAFLADVTKEQLGVFATTIFERIGYFTSPGEGLTVHGINFIVYKPDLSEPEIALRCRPDSGEVSMGDISSFWTKITSQGYGRGIFVTNMTFSPGAFAFAEQRDLLLVDAKGLESGIEALPPKHRQTILKIVEPIQKNTQSTEEENAPVTFGSPFSSSSSSSTEWDEPGPEAEETLSPFSEVSTENEQWLPQPEFEKDHYPPLQTGDIWDTGTKNTGGVSTMVAALCPMMLLLAGFLVWEPLMGGGQFAAPEESFVAPVVSQYIESQQNGADFELVAEMARAPKPPVGPTIIQLK